MSHRILHVALEGGPATFGGLGRVATQMLDTQNKFQIKNNFPFDASIITPLYQTLFTSFTDKIEIAQIKHQYNNELITSKIYLTQQGNNKYYLISPPEEYQYLFNINTLPDIYLDTESSYFIERLKFFNSAVAAYVNTTDKNTQHPNPQILQLHDWQAALVPKILTEVYNNKTIKTVFTVHIDNSDSGSYPSYHLEGIGLKFNQEVTLLKGIGLTYADKVVAVSPKFLHECITSVTDNNDMEYLRKLFVWCSIKNKTIGITNGINYADYCPVGKLIQNRQNLCTEKLHLKRQLATKLRGSRSTWKINPELPLILYVGRFSPEKGVDTFEQIIRAIDGRAIFIAIGRSMTDDVYNAILNHSRQKPNVFISFSEKEQADFIDTMRAAADFIFVPSRREACGLVVPEGLANGAICITTGVGGIGDLVTKLEINNQNNNSTGNGILFEVMPEGEENPDLTRAINQAIELWESLSPEEKNSIQCRIMQEAEKFDWQAPGGALEQYLDVYNEILESPVQFNSVSLTMRSK